MRVYFNGSFGNGKTTCKNWVAKEYKIKAIPEIARTVLAEMMRAFFMSPPMEILYLHS